MLASRRISQGESQGTWAVVVLVHTIILASLAVLALIYLNPSLNLPRDAEFMITLACISLLTVWLWCLWSWRALSRSLFDPYALFLIAAGLFHGGYAIVYALRLFRGDFLDLTQVIPISLVTVSPETILQTLFLVTLGLAAFHAGGLFAVLAGRTDHAVQESNTASTEQALRLVGWSLLAVSLVPAFLFFKDAIALAASSGYFEYLKQEGPRGFGAAPRILASFLVPAGLFLLAGSKNQRFTIVLSGLIILAYSSAQFSIGYRGSSVMPLIAYAWVYHRCIRRLPKTLLISAGSLLLFVVFPLTRFFREATGGTRFSLSEMLNTFISIDNPVVAIVSEMGNTLMTVAYTVSRVPDYRDFDMGLSYLFALSSVIPNLFWEAHPSYARGTLSNWLVQTIEPASANFGYYSFGFSFIAEAYLNFGWFGAPIAIAILGLLLGRFVLWAQSSADPAKIAMLGAFTSFLLIFARGESHELIRSLVWYSLIPFLGVCALRAFIRPRPYEFSGSTSRTKEERVL